MLNSNKMVFNSNVDSGIKDEDLDIELSSSKQLFLELDGQYFECSQSDEIALGLLEQQTTLNQTKSTDKKCYAIVLMVISGI